jgi:hypothetical protein
MSSLLASEQLSALRKICHKAQAACKSTLKSTIGPKVSRLTNSFPKFRKDWTPEKGYGFEKLLGNLLDGWSAMAEASIYQLFNGTDESIAILSQLIQDGKLIDGMASTPPKDPPSDTSIKAYVARSYYAYAIPAAWSISGTKAFVLDAGEYPCGTRNPFSGFSSGGWLNDDTAKQTYVCVDNKMYYLVYPKGDALICDVGGGAGGLPQRSCTANPFSAPPGLETLDGIQYGQITSQDLVRGYVSQLYLQFFLLFKINIDQNIIQIT